MNEENEVYSDKDSYLTISKKVKEKEPEYIFFQMIILKDHM